MLSAIKKFFEENMSIETPSKVPEHSLKLATAALLIEMMNQDDTIHEMEINTIRQVLMDNFSITSNEADKLHQLAEQEMHNATDYYQFTRLIAENYSQQEKIQVIEMLWRVAFSDNYLDAYEEHMVRRIADLIYVSHKDFIQAKLKVQNQMFGQTDKLNSTQIF